MDARQSVGHPTFLSFPILSPISLWLRASTPPVRKKVRTVPVTGSLPRPIYALLRFKLYARDNVATWGGSGAIPETISREEASPRWCAFENWIPSVWIVTTLLLQFARNKKKINSFTCKPKNCVKWKNNFFHDEIYFYLVCSLSVSRRLSSV